MGSGNSRGAIEVLAQQICTFCDFNLKIVGEAGSIIWIQAISYNNERKIALFEAVEDTTLENKFKIFRLSINESLYHIDINKYPLIFNLIPLTNNPNIFVHPESCPE